MVKTHAEGVVESMGNYVELHADKRRGRMDISDVGVEALIHWNGPPLAWADKLGLDRVFPLHHHCVLCLVQVELGNKSDSIVTQMLRQEIPKLPCLCFFIKYF